MRDHSRTGQSAKRRTVLKFTVVAVSAALGGSAYAEDASASANDQALAAETDAALINAGQQANAALESLMSVRGEVTPPSAPYPPPTQIPLANVPAELRQTITMSWNGNSVDLAAKIAAAIGYSFTVSGTKPATPTVVTMVFDHEPAVWALQRLGIRIRDDANVGVDPNDHTVHYTYKLMTVGAGVGITGSKN